MALAIYLKGEGNQALVAKESLKDLVDCLDNIAADDEEKKVPMKWHTFDGWHGKKILIPLDQISHVIEETDAQMKKNMEENKRRAEEMAQSQGRKVIQTPGFRIPGRGNN